MLLLRLLGVGLVLLGVLFIGPISTHGPMFRLRRLKGPVSFGVEPLLWVRVWFVRLMGVIMIVGGLIYVVHPPARLR